MNPIMSLVFAVVLTTWAAILVAELGHRDRLDAEEPRTPPLKPAQEPEAPADDLPAELLDGLFDEPAQQTPEIGPARQYPDDPQPVHTVRDSQADTFDDEEDQR